MGVDPEIAALAGTAGTTLVTLLTTEGWERAKDAIASLWRRPQPERVDSIEAELRTTREELLAAQASGDPATEAELRVEWQGRIRRLLVAHPAMAEELRSALAQLAPDAQLGASVTQRASASGEARVYQAGRDLHYGQR